MDWTQAFTIILTNITSMVAVWYAFYQITKVDIKENREEFLIFSQKMDAEISKRDALWANLLDKIYKVEKQTYAIKLDQSRKKS